MNNTSDWTGERLETFIFNQTTIEHLHRYAIAKEFVKDKTVLDIACGEGYGADLLAQDATFVTGVDIDEPTIQRAVEKYRRPNLEFACGQVERIPLPDHAFDVVTSFETIEHTSAQGEMLDEIKRVLKPDGLLILSSPEKKYYSDERHFENPFHRKELYKEDLAVLLKSRFAYTVLLDQRIVFGSMAVNDSPGRFKVYEGDYHRVAAVDDLRAAYHIAMASDEPLAAPDMSFFVGGEVLETVLRERINLVKRSMSYRLGHCILWPLRFVRASFRK